MKKIRNKILVLVILCCTFISFMVGGVSIMQSYKSNKQQLAELEKQLRDEFDLNAKNEVKTIVTMLEGFDKKVKYGELKLDEAKVLAADVIREAQYGEEGYFWVDTVEGVNVVLLGSDAEGKNRLNLQDDKGNRMIKEFINIAVNNDGGFYDYWFNKKGETKVSPKRAYVKQFKPFGWVVGTGNYIDDIDELVLEKKNKLNKMMNSAVISMIVLIIIITILASILAIIISNKISKPINLITDLINNTSKLDLTVNDNEDKILKYKDETGIMGRAVINLRKALIEIVATIQNDSKKVNKYSEELSISTGEMLSAIDGVSKTTEELANGAQEEAKEAQNGTEKLLNLADKITESSEIAKEVKNLSIKAKELNDTNTNFVNELTDKFKVNNDVNNQLQNNINLLSDKSVSIGKILDAISTIAQQTNLLALNAAIEAARAGEAGKGFAVVADEIRLLSEQTSESTKQIAGIINEIQSEISSTKVSMDGGIEALKEINNTLDKSKLIIKDMDNSNNVVLEKVDTLVLNINNIDSDKNGVVNVIQGVSAISEESAAAAEEVSASVEEQTAAMENVANTAEDLKEITFKMEEIVNKFNIE